MYGEGETINEAINNHGKRMCRLMERCVERGIVLNSDEKKSLFSNNRTYYGKHSCSYMGRVFSAEEIHADPVKVKASVEMPRPDSVLAVRHFFGMATSLAVCSKAI